MVVSNAAVCGVLSLTQPGCTILATMPLASSSPLRCYSLSLCGTLPQARALVHYLDGISRRVSVHPVEMEPWDVYITEGALVDPKLHPLEGVVVCGV